MLNLFDFFAHAIEHLGSKYLSHGYIFQLVLFLAYHPLACILNTKLFSLHDGDEFSN